VVGSDVRRRIESSVRELRDRPPADFLETVEGISRLTCEIIGATDVLLCFAAQKKPDIGPLHGWTTHAPYRFGPNADHDRRVLDEWYRAPRRVAAYPSVQALIESHGRPRAMLRADVGDDGVWTRSNVDALLAESGIGDRLFAGAPLQRGVELLLVGYRREAQPAFGVAERDAMTALVSVLRDVGRRIARAHGLIDAHAPLSRREIEVLAKLLLGLSEPAVAAGLGLTARSLHQYVVAIHRKLGVHSRGELMAHFLAPARHEAALVRYASRLSQRELGVFRGLVRGLSEKEIAEVARVSSRAVHHLVGAIYRKIGVHSRARLTAQVLADTAIVAPNWACGN
jgi:DNA-binding NarL/FixJ family response regulator